MLACGGHVGSRGTLPPGRRARAEAMASRKPSSPAPLGFCHVKGRVVGSPPVKAGGFLQSLDTVRKGWQDPSGFSIVVKY